MKFIKISVIIIPVILLNNYLFSQWFQQNSNTVTDLYSVWDNPSTALACGSGGKIFQTTNFGLNWVNIYSAASNATIYNSLCLNYSMYVAGGDPNQGIIMKSNDFGTTWISQQTNTLYTLKCIFFLNSLTGWACGENGINNGNMIKTTNGGLNWSLINGVPNLYYKSIFFLDSTTGYSGGYYSKIYKSTNGGTNWYDLGFYTAGTSTINSIIFYNTTGYISTSSAYGGVIPNGVYKTTNAGLNWVQQQEPSGGLGMYFFNINTGYTVGGYGQIFKTTNGGTNWFTQASNTTKILRSIYFSDLNNGWIVGDSGLILKTTNGGGPIGIQSISHNVPKEFQLYQNYPNPFNPGTSIKFQVSSTRLVKLLIYDALGKIADEPVNTELQPGTYEIDWDASHFSSGVYLYRIIAGDYTETRRMVLLK